MMILQALSLERMANLDALYGLPTGMFNGDELLPSPPTRNPFSAIFSAIFTRDRNVWRCRGDVQRNSHYLGHLLLTLWPA